MISANLSEIFYLISGVLFILALRGLWSPETSRKGNVCGILERIIERKVKLVLTTDTCYKKLYQGKRLNFEFERTKSRLSEMSTLDYQKLTHKH